MMTPRWPLLEGAEPWSHEGDSGTGILMVHGFTGSPRAMRPLAERFADAGHSVEVIRLPGHGTHWRDLARTRYADWRVAVELAYDALGRRCDSLVLFGLSLGGTLVLDVAAGRCRRGSEGTLAGVVAVSPQLVEREDPLSSVAGILQYLVPFAPREVASLPRDDIAKPGVTEDAYTIVPSKAGYSLLRELPRIRDAVGEITVPVLVAWSPNDRSVPPASSETLLELLDCDTTAVECARSGHVITLDHDADLLHDETVAFIDKVASAKTEAAR